MFETLIIPILLVIVTLFVVLSVIIFIVSTVYDAVCRLPSPEQIELESPAATRNTTVIIENVKDVKDVELTLGSLMALSDQICWILIIDHHSLSLQQKKLIRQLLKNYPLPNLKFIARKSSSAQEAAVTNSFRRYGKGEYVMRVEAGLMVDAMALLNSIEALKKRPDVQAINADIMVDKQLSVSYIFSTYLNFLSVYARKFNQVIGLSGGPSPGIYKRECFKTSGLSVGYKARSLSKGATFYYLPKNSLLKLLIASNKDYRSIVSATFKNYILWPLGVLYILSGLALPILMTYVLYLALALHEPALLMVSLGLLSLFLLMSVWSAEERPLTEKVRLSLLIPVSYLLFYAYSISRLCSTLKPAVWPHFMNPKTIY